MFGSILHDKTHCHANHTPSLNTLLILGTSSTILQGNSYIGDPGRSHFVPYVDDCSALWIGNPTLIDFYLQD